MCGITGIIAFGNEGKRELEKINQATDCLQLRGPDDAGIYRDDQVALGHRRLSVIDTSHAAVQPMHDATKRFYIIFNGEFFNYKIYREELKREGVVFRTTSDTEVLLNLYIKEGVKCLQKVNGFFALAIYDSLEKTIFIARDRIGVKPLLYYVDSHKLFFASEMKALTALNVPMEINADALHCYFQLNYFPPGCTVFSSVRKLPPGSYLYINLNEEIAVNETKYYTIPFQRNNTYPPSTYEEACKKFQQVLESSVEKRLVSDVPLGAFLSGGIDSSVIVALASKHTHRLNTFSIGFKDDLHFDETKYAQLVARKFNTNHTEIRLTTEDLLQSLFPALDYLDEPFADSSALAVYILSRETRKHVTVALSGDGADELFAGYHKHRAEWLVRNNSILVSMMKKASPLFSVFQGSRQSVLGNKLRQMHRFAEGVSLTDQERYWRWCSIASENDVQQLLKVTKGNIYNTIKSASVAAVSKDDFNSVLANDVQLVLPGDMLVKVDMMSMANSLEVRNPFLDYEVVNYAFTLPASFKIDGSGQKRIVRDAFREILPAELYSRPKQGFEIPLLRWFKTALHSLIVNDLLEDDFVVAQNLFNPVEIKKLKQRLNSSSPGDVAARIWALFVFQYWWKKNFKV